MKELKYFNQCKSLDEIKAEYKRGIQGWLPTKTNTGNKSQLESLDNEYYEISQRPKFKQQSQEIQEEFLAFPKIVKELVMVGLDMEMCGSWLWVSGNTYDHADKLKELGLKFSPNKKLWYYRPKWSRSTNSTPVEMEFIRKKYGSDAGYGEIAFGKAYNTPEPTNKQGGEVLA